MRHGGDIVLCHDSGLDRTQTVAALAAVLPKLRRGLRFAPLVAPVAPQAGPAAVSWKIGSGRFGKESTVQTFLPYPDFARTASVLDRRRLGNQRSEVLVILRVCHIPTYGWQNHPAVRMWRCYEQALICYGAAICDQWAARGHTDTVKDKLLVYSSAGTPRTQQELARWRLLPFWLGDERLHRSHQSALLRKNPQRYQRYFPDVPDDLPYYWPV